MQRNLTNAYLALPGRTPAYPRFMRGRIELSELTVYYRVGSPHFYNFYWFSRIALLVLFICFWWGNRGLS